MARTAREQSNSEIYHVMLRGIDRKDIFFVDEDYEYFRTLLKRYKDKLGFELYAYCLMSNHVHLLIKVEHEFLSEVIKKIGISYAYYFNLKYDRCGHLFQDRFRSETVEDSRYFLTALRYILQNPVKAGICCVPVDYKYSSARAYFGKYDGLTDIKLANKICGNDELLKFLSTENDDSCMEMSNQSRRGISDEEASKLVVMILGKSPDYGKANRKLLAGKIAAIHAQGVSIRQLNRLSGIPRGIIERCLKM